MLALTISLLIMCGCSGSAKYEEKYQNWRENYLSLTEHEITAAVTSSDDEKVCDYTLRYALSSESETVEVLAPETIARIKANIEQDSVRLDYNGVMLETGSSLSEKLSPLTALPVFNDVIREGHLENSWRETEDETELVVTELEMPDGTRMTLWLNIADMKPVHADIRSGDKIQIKISITEFR